ncbi:hypothetical protein V6Z12_A11G004700 [Gossypium hirsutum]
MFHNGQFDKLKTKGREKIMGGLLFGSLCKKKEERR